MTFQNDTIDPLMNRPLVDFGSKRQNLLVLKFRFAVAICEIRSIYCSLGKWSLGNGHRDALILS